MKTAAFLSNVPPFPLEDQSDPFFSAFSSVLIPVLGYTEEPPLLVFPKGILLRTMRAVWSQPAKAPERPLPHAPHRLRGGFWL